MVTFAYDEINEIVFEFGVPEHCKTDDGEDWYWCFSGRELPVADTLAELFCAAKRTIPEPPSPSHKESRDDG